MDGLITREALRILRERMTAPGAHSRSLEAVMFRERLKSSVAAATSAWRADEVMPEVKTMIRIRIPERYKRGSEWMG